MKKWRSFMGLLAAMGSLAAAGFAYAADEANTVGAAPTDQLPDMPLAGGHTMLPDGWDVSPVGASTKLAGDMPTKMLLTPDGKFLLAVTAGYTEHGISVVDVSTGQLIDHVAVPATFAGMCMDRTGTHVLLSTGGANGYQAIVEGSNGTAKKIKPSAASAGKPGVTLYAFALENGHLKPLPAVDIPAIPQKKRFIGGLAMGADGSTYVVNIQENKVYRLGPDGSTIGVEVGYRPCAVALSPSGHVLAVANWGDQSVTLLDATTMATFGKIAVGSHPADVAWSNDGRIFVANAGGDTASVINSQTMTVIETIRTSLDFQVPVGSTPIALAVDNAGKRLYVANADNNDVVVVDISNPQESKVLGFIPTGWYPSALAVSADGKKVFIGTGKALDKFYPSSGTKQHIGFLLTGHVSIVPAPSGKTLDGYTRMVIANTPVPRDPGLMAKNERDVMAGAFSKIKHVVYVINENRTYDQVLGDLKQGNGDASLAMFGRKVTPNKHAIAEQWVLLDNLYCNGEVSMDGHAWCDAAYANDYNQHEWENKYSRRNPPDADERLKRSSGGYIWDEAIEHHLSFLSYGEGAEFMASDDEAPVVNEASMPPGTMSKPWQAVAWNMGQGQPDYQRISIFINDLHAAEQTGNWPSLIVMSLPEDHTVARRPGLPTPDACVASNDWAVGKLVEAVSHSKFWPETAIFIIEDDAQNGQDHVDAHRTNGFVISPYTRRAAVDHTMYTTSSMVRTIELMLNLPPMTQYDAAATPMFASFMSSPNFDPYVQRKPLTDLTAKNPAKGRGARASEALDLSDLDCADPDAFNQILWDWFKPDTQMPAPVRSMVRVE